MINSIDPKLDNIIETIGTLVKEMEARLKPSRLTTTVDLPINFQNPDLVKHTKKLIGSASTVITSRSTVWGGSEMRLPHSSENGQPLDRGQKAVIEDWIPYLAGMEEEPP